MDEDEPTQATQNVLDPRRVGKQNSGFSDEDISDIICILYPHSESARQEVLRLAHDDSPYIIGKDEMDNVEPDYDLEDHASRFESNPSGHGNYALILRLSSAIKNPANGFAFGRNINRCDVVFTHDPYKRVSNIHFRIYVNEYGNVMVEDQSTNGTFVDRTLLLSRSKDPSKPPITRRVLTSGSLIKILLHNESKDLTFRVRIPRRDDEYAGAYNTKVAEYFVRNKLARESDTIRPSDKGPPDIFRTAAENAGGGLRPKETTPARAINKRGETIRPEWNGSGKYNRVGMIGKGAFAVVYKVTSKYDGRPYAAKELEKRRFIKNGVLDQKVENEMKIMQRVEHPNIVRYIEHFDWDERLLIIIMEYVPGGDLGKLISEEGPFDEHMVKSMARQLLDALNYLHTKNITHRDVKPDNILINSLEPLEVKLTDFGLSKMVDSEQTFLRTFCGTLLYCAPEVYTEYAEYDENGYRNRGKKSRRMPGQRYSHAVDIWSLAGVLFFTLTKSPPYPVKTGISHSELLHKIMTTRLGIAPLEQFNVSEEGIDFLSRMLQRRPEQRATIEELAEHPWLGGHGSSVQASQSFDEITDDEDMAAQLIDLPWDDHGRIIDVSDDESEKENGTNFRPGRRPQQQRLFGEVGISAIGSSGVIPGDFLNLPADDTSMRETEILGPEGDEAYDSGDNTARARAQSHFHQSADQLQSLVENVASQSLGDKENEPVQPDLLSSRYQSDYLNGSKRKPPSQELSDLSDENTPTEKPFIKRLKSESNIEGLSENAIEELKLLACVPQINRLSSGRQLDEPVDKVTFWEQDRTTWHLNYPEMTQLQYDAFNQAARDRGEKFRPGQTPLWDLARRYFPPTPRMVEQPRQDVSDFPPTAMPTDSMSIPDTLQPDPKIEYTIPAVGARAIGLIESSTTSLINGVSFPITDSLISFGRGPENTEVFEPPSESRIPKYAFKILLWKEGYDPARDPSKVVPPWVHSSTADESSYGFYLSTKATLGIRVNGQAVPSSDAKNPSGPSRYWTRIYDGDDLVVWGGQEPQNQTSLTFRCFWGSSSSPRHDKNHALDFAPEELAQQLDLACQRTEKRIRDAGEKRLKNGAAISDLEVRTRTVDLERARSIEFEQRRQEAIAFIQARQLPNSRRSSPASAPPTVTIGRVPPQLA
ncbi:unnamed protein product [Clonostachys rosea]|uniref:Autophagy-related protein 1 n=1 Tax=Bionectria ochroleuca TaxID=29856 RepID=A0ABY6TNZ8_BIOOC|nr:unnamed protein product [Clonostachys rosea]